MKKSYFFTLLLFPILCFGQWTQLGQDIYGAAADDWCGRSVSLNSNGNVMVVGVPYNDDNGISSGYIQVYSFNGSSWTQMGADIDGVAEGDRFGFSTSISDDGNTIAIGAYGNDDNGDGTGQVRVFNFNGTTWQQVGGNINGELLGERSAYALDLDSDGDTIAIGSYLYGGIDDGIVRIFRFSGSSWGLIGSITALGSIEEQFGVSVSLSNDGNTFAASAMSWDNNSGRGYVTIYNYDGSNWNLLGNKIDGEAGQDQFGRSVSISSAGNIVAIGTPFNDGNGSNSGHIRVYQFNGTDWIQMGSDIDGEAADDRFGFSLSMSADGQTIASGAYKNDNNGQDSGNVRVFTYDGSQWQQVANEIAGSAIDDYSGYSVSLNSDASRIAIGTVRNDSHASNAGLVRVYGDAPLSAEKNTLENTVELFPNPTSDQTKINLGSFHKNARVSLFDILGNLISSSNYKNVISIDVATINLKSGIYFVKINSPRKEATLKLIKK